MFNNQFSVEGNKSERMMAISDMVTLVHAGKYSLYSRCNGISRFKGQGVGAQDSVRQEGGQAHKGGTSIQKLSGFVYLIVFLLQ